jgi:hypothetical protein
LHDHGIDAELLGQFSLPLFTEVGGTKRHDERDKLIGPRDDGQTT